MVDESLQTSEPGVFACGNALHIHDLADYASEEGEIAARLRPGLPWRCERAMGKRWRAKLLLRGHARIAALRSATLLRWVTGEGVRYVVPQRISMRGMGCGDARAEDSVTLSFRPSRAG